MPSTLPLLRTGLALTLSAALTLGTVPLRVIAPQPAFARGAPESFADLAANVSDAVVNIAATQTVEAKRTKQGDGNDSAEAAADRRSPKILRSVSPMQRRAALHGPRFR